MPEEVLFYNQEHNPRYMAFSFSGFFISKCSSGVNGMGVSDELFIEGYGLNSCFRTSTLVVSG